MHLLYSLFFIFIFFRFWIIFIIIMLNYFLGSLPISSSFIWNFVFLVCNLYSISLLFFFLFFSFLFFFTYCVWGLFSPDFRENWILSLKKIEFFPWRSLNSFFLLVSALLMLVQWFVWAFYRVRFVLSFCLFVCLFVFPLMGKAEWCGNPVCWWLGLYFCCLDKASYTGCYWWLGNARFCTEVVFFVWVPLFDPP